MEYNFSESENDLPLADAYNGFLAAFMGGIGIDPDRTDEHHSFSVESNSQTQDEVNFHTDHSSGCTVIVGYATDAGYAHPTVFKTADGDKSIAPTFDKDALTFTLFPGDMLHSAARQRSSAEGGYRFLVVAKRHMVDPVSFSHPDADQILAMIQQLRTFREHLEIERFLRMFAVPVRDTTRAKVVEAGNPLRDMARKALRYSYWHIADSDDRGSIAVYSNSHWATQAAKFSWALNDSYNLWKPRIVSASNQSAESLTWLYPAKMSDIHELDVHLRVGLSKAGANQIAKEIGWGFLKSIDLSGTHIRVPEVKIIASALKRKKPPPSDLKKLDLSGCLDEEGAAIIIEALKDNTYLDELKMIGPPLNDKSRAALRKICTKNPHLKASFQFGTVQVDRV